MTYTLDTIAAGRAAPVRRAIPARLREGVARESILIAALSALVFFWLIAVLFLLGNDSWMTVLWGREVAQHGIPRHDALTVMSHGKAFVDQQWLAQLPFWGVYALGGMRLALLLAISMLLAPVAIAATLARRRGASPTAVLAFVLVPALNFASILRAQLFSQLLFVALLALLLAESRRPSRRALLAFPLLVVWANLHGAVLQGAALVALLGAIENVRARRPSSRSIALIVVPWLCALATPYGLDAIGYYRMLLGNPILRQIEGEWRPPAFPDGMGFAVFLLAAAFVALVVKRRRDLNAFELATLLVTLAGALTAVRSVPWFAYSCLVLLPPLADRVLRRGAVTAPPHRVALLLAGVPAALAAVTLSVMLARPLDKIGPLWPRQAGLAVQQALRADPHARVFPSYEYPDWLLLTIPEARARVAYDGFFEELTHDQLAGVMDYLYQVGPDWERPTRGYRVIVLNPQLERSLVRTYDRRRTRVLYRDDNVVVFDRGSRA